jgi:hypothetical protein
MQQTQNLKRQAVRITLNKAQSHSRQCHWITYVAAERILQISVEAIMAMIMYGALLNLRKRDR